MISYQEALQIISQHTFQPKVISVSIEAAPGRILAKDLMADRDFPPYDRVTMDGIAIRFDDFEKGQREFPIAETIGAGMPQKDLNIPGRCVQIMTGAIMPNGVDTVIRYEDLEIENEVARIVEESVSAQQNVHFKGQDKKAGEIVLKRGIKLSPVELIVAAAIGKSSLKVLELPKAAIITTGDELVDIEDQPLAHQIRRSSNYGVQALMNSWGITTQQFHLNDDKQLMLKEIQSIIASYELIVITGGVSRGKFDYLPEVLDELGVERHFHKVKQRPGKPFWFGSTAMGNTVFALPGNPVSSYVCATVYLKHWLDESLNIKSLAAYARLSNDFNFPPQLTYFIECQLKNCTDGAVEATTFKGNGSGDFANLTAADGFLILPENLSVFKAGEVYPYIRYRN